MTDKHYHVVQFGSSGTQHAKIPCDCYDGLRVENQRLRNEQAVLEETNRWQAAEIRRLKTALEKIEAGYGQRLSAAELASIARQAL